LLDDIPAPWRRNVYVCDKPGCGRTVRADDKDNYSRWLVSGVPVAKRFLVVRCPQHITHWALSQSGYGVSAEMMRWAERMKREDVPPLNPYAEPYTLDGAFNRGDE
jgi:hypothetical protein